MLKVIIVVILFSRVYCQTKNRNCNYTALDIYLGSIIGAYGLKEVELPANRTELKHYCRSQANADHLAKQFSKNCMNGLVESVITSTLSRNRKLNEQNCGANRTEQTRLLSISRCVTTGKTRGTNVCWNKLIDSINQIKELNNYKIRIPLFCCNYYDWKVCTLNVYEDIGSPQCHRQVIGNIEHRITKGLIQPLKALCFDFEDDSKNCENLIKQMPKNSTKLLLSRSKTAYLPLIEIFDSL